MNRPTFALAAAASLLLGGCQTVFDLVGVEMPLSASEARKYDGSYQGTIRQASQNGPACPGETGEKVVMIGDGVLWYAYTPNTVFAAPVRYDGVVDAASGPTTLKGKITGNTLDMTVQSPTCVTRMSMDYIYNHS